MCLHLGFIAEHAAQLALVKKTGAVALDGEGFEGGVYGVLASRDGGSGEIGRDVLGDLHGKG